MIVDRIATEKVWLNVRQVVTLVIVCILDQGGAGVNPTNEALIMGRFVILPNMHAATEFPITVLI